MHHSALTRRLDVESARVWDIHYLARERQEAGEDVILLTVGDPDFDTPPAIIDEAGRSMRRGRTRYGPTAGDPLLREAIARHHEQLTAQPVSAENVVVFAGAQSALFSCALCIADPGDEIAVFEPRYVTYDGVIDTPGAVRVDVPLAAPQGFRFDPDALGRAVTPRTRAILLNTPHNPTGLVAAREELEAIAAIAKRHDLWVLSDEVYASLTYDAEHIAIASLPGMAERTVTINSLSKSHAMQGWRLGWAVGPRPLARHLTHLVVSMVFGTPPFTQDAALFALTHEIAEVEAMERAYRARRDLVCARIERLSRPLLPMAAGRDVRAGRRARHRSLRQRLRLGPAGHRRGLGAAHRDLRGERGRVRAGQSDRAGGGSRGGVRSDRAVRTVAGQAARALSRMDGSRFNR